MVLKMGKRKESGPWLAECFEPRLDFLPFPRLALAALAFLVCLASLALAALEFAFLDLEKVIFYQVKQRKMMTKKAWREKQNVLAKKCNFIL